ncbi:phenylalanine--tRNA ligase subunit beta [Pelistega europaea]|uniref:Phenylalanine--tRNA ligase beta subunit n=1 Tax=Pelistega europaea TaxID=106147 RepID=A0A7Y4P5Z9_9BURK|nr:phenylalanine--tRNA ligase subunit beta [Pelistega europaea]NOL49394.1 phenylalanine--tRNA ligase subunit beta [Pelistega europaea]
MLVLESWLREVANPNLNTQELADRLTMAGLEVEGVEPVAPAFSGVVVAEIKTIAQHPNADKLRICQVDAGTGELLQIVCGAPNAAAGIKVPLAMIGAVLPGNFKISKGKLRGEESFGMLCSARELGISEDSSGLLILDNSLPVGQNIREALNLDDQIFEIKLTPNRADCLSVYGVAREVAALTGVPLKVFDFTPVNPEITDTLKVNVHAPDLCGRFAGRVIRGVNAKAQTPEWMKKRLEGAGQRSVSALVDISNYVMLELGRPTHIFDLNKIHGELNVRWAKEGESLELLNGQTVELDSSVGIIAAGETIESLAGIMGGEATAVSLDTTDIYLEAAFWYPEAIAGRARRFKFSSEASHRFERGVDFQNIQEHIAYITRLIQQICGGKAGPVDDQIINLPERKPVQMRLARCQKILGVQVSKEQVANIFTQLGLSFTEQDEVFTVQSPSFRFDIEIEEDLIEEVARIYGFDNIPDVAPLAPAVMLPTHETVRSEHVMRQVMASQGYQEVVNFSFVERAWEEDLMGNKDPIALLNPIASQLAVMRSGLIAGLVANIISNAKRKQNRVKVFELGRVFSRNSAIQDGDLTVANVDQPLHLAGASWGLAYPEQWGVPARQVDFFDVKKDIQNLYGKLASQLQFVPLKDHPALHPGRSAQILLNGQAIGMVGELHPVWVQAYELNHAPVVFEVTVASLKKLPLHQPRELSNQPVVIRDLAIWAPNTLEVQSLLDAIKKAVKSTPELAIVQDINLFDIWKDAKSTTQERSLAFRFTLQDAAVTLEDARVEQCMAKVLETWVTQFGIRQR